MGKLAFVFPGQGAQAVGMGKALSDAFPAAADIISRSDDALGEKLSSTMFNGPEDELTLTANTQPAILTHSLAALELIKAEGIQPDVVAGHSLGEYSAVVAAGGLSQADAVMAVRLRGALMQEAVPVGIGAMAALIGPDPETVESICGKARENEVLSIANINSPGQIVIAGHAEAVDRAIDIAAEAGAKRAIRLQVSAPFHCSLMTPAQDGMDTHLAKLKFDELSVPLINNADVAQLTDVEDVRKGLVKQVVSPVRWLETMQAMIEMGVDTVVELGPGRVLSGLFKRTDRSLTLHNVEDPESLEKTLNALKGGA